MGASTLTSATRPSRCPAMPTCLARARSATGLSTQRPGCGVSARALLAGAAAGLCGLSLMPSAGAGPAGAARMPPMPLPCCAPAVAGGTGAAMPPTAAIEQIGAAMCASPAQGGAALLAALAAGGEAAQAAVKALLAPGCAQAGAPEAAIAALGGTPELSDPKRIMGCAAVHGLVGRPAGACPGCMPAPRLRARCARPTPRRARASHRRKARNSRCSSALQVCSGSGAGRR